MNKTYYEERAIWYARRQIQKITQTEIAKKLIKKEFEKNKDKIDNLQGTLFFRVITNIKFIIIYIIVLLTIYSGMLIGAVNLNKQAGATLAFSAIVVFMLGVVGTLVLQNFFTKKIVVLYTMRQLLLIDTKSDLAVTLNLSEIERLNYEKKRLIFEDKNGKIIELSISNLFGLPEFIQFLHKEHNYIFGLMPLKDKAKYNKFIKRAEYSSGLHSEKCLI